jgi:hypothetical protein
MLSHRVGCDGTLPPCRQGRPSLSSRRDPDSNREAESKRPRRSRPLGSPIPSHGTLSRRRFESSVLCIQGTARRSQDDQLRETAEYSAAGHRTIQLITTAQPRQGGRGCVSSSGGVLRVDPGNTTPDQEVAGPAGPVTAGPIRMTGLADCAFLDGYPHAATPRIHAVGTAFRRAPGRLRLPGTPTPGFKPGLRPREGRMLAGLHHVGVLPPRLESNRRPPGLHVAAATAAGCEPAASRTLGAYGAARPSLSERTETELSRAPPGTLARRSEAGYRMKAGDNPVFPSPVRVVRVGARLCGGACPELAGLRRTLVIDTDAVPAVVGQTLRALALEVLAEHARG